MVFKCISTFPAGGSRDVGLPAQKPCRPQRGSFPLTPVLMKIRWFMYAPVQEIGTALVQLDRVMPHMAAMTPSLLALSGVASTLFRR